MTRLDAVGRQHLERRPLGRRRTAACVSLPMNSGPAMPCAARYSQIAWVMARMCASVKVPSSEVPRWPLVPKLTSSLRVGDVGRAVVVVALEAATSMSKSARRGLAGERRKLRGIIGAHRPPHTSQWRSLALPVRRRKRCRRQQRGNHRIGR